LPSVRTVTVCVSSGSFHTLMWRTSDSPTRYSGETAAAAGAARPLLPRSVSVSFAACACPQANPPSNPTHNRRPMVNFLKVICHSQLDVVSAGSHLFLFRSLAEQDHFDRLKEDVYIQRNRKVLDVEESELQLSLGIFHARAISILDLSPPGKPRSHGVALREEWQASLQHFAEVRLLRARTYQAHLPMQDVEELRQLIQAVTANKGADASNTAIAIGGPARTPLLPILAHGAKFQNLELRAVQASSFLLEQHRPPALEHDRGRHQAHDRQGNNQDQRRDTNIHEPFGGKQEPRFPEAVREDQPAWRKALHGNPAGDALEDRI